MNNIFIISYKNKIDPINKLPLKFKKYQGAVIDIYYKSDDKICELIEKFFEKAKINDNYNKYFKFIFNSKELDFIYHLILILS